MKQLAQSARTSVCMTLSHLAATGVGLFLRSGNFAL